MTNQFWNERYASEEYVYGTRPNQFLKEQLEKITPGRILFPAEGEGRNAVFAARNGWDVTAFDSSIEAKRKAKQLAVINKTTLDYQLNDFENVNFDSESFDCIALIYAHMQPEKRKTYHQKLMNFLKKGGTLVLEGFSKNQIYNATGGPKNIDMLFSEDELKGDFYGFSELQINKLEIEFDEGRFHQGKASVIRVYGVK